MQVVRGFARARPGSMQGLSCLRCPLRSAAAGAEGWEKDLANQPRCPWGNSVGWKNAWAPFSSFTCWADSPLIGGGTD